VSEYICKDCADTLGIKNWVPDVVSDVGLKSCETCGSNGDLECVSSSTIRLAKFWADINTGPRSSAGIELLHSYQSEKFNIGVGDET